MSFELRVICMKLGHFFIKVLIGPLTQIGKMFLKSMLFVIRKLARG
jgi:hypothetical protein